MYVLLSMLQTERLCEQCKGLNGPERASKHTAGKYRGNSRASTDLKRVSDHE